MGLIGGAMGFGQSMLGASQKSAAANQEYNNAKRAVTRQNILGQLQTARANERTLELYKYSVGRYKQNVSFIQDEISFAGAQEQRRLNELFGQAAFRRQAKFVELAQVMGYNSAAFEGSSRSRERGDLLSTLGAMGRDIKQESEYLAGELAESEINRKTIGRQGFQQAMNQHASVAVLPELQMHFDSAMPARGYQPNMGMTIANAAMGGISQGLQWSSYGTKKATGTGTGTGKP